MRSNREIDLPFQPECRESMLSGKKRATTRTKRYGYPGDWFSAFGKAFILTAVFPTFLDVVVGNNYLDEGFDSPGELIRYWDRLHPYITYLKRPGRKVFFHRFTSRDQEAPIAALPKNPAAEMDQQA